ncbi:MAG: PfkB family carbohydrate kinase, partial [Bacteroidota bacterium]
MKVISFGEILWDIIEGAYHIGGAPFNFAAHLTQCGADVAMISRLGKDEIGKRAFQAVCDLSVGTKYLQWDTKHPTGTVNVFLQNGQPTYTIHPEVAYDYIDFENLKLAGLLEDEIDIFSFGTLAQRHEKSRNTLNQILEN